MSIFKVFRRLYFLNQAVKSCDVFASYMVLEDVFSNGVISVDDSFMEELLIITINNDTPKIAKLILEKCTIVDYEKLIIKCVHSGKPSVMEKLIQHGVKNSEIPLKIFNKALIISIKKNNYGITKLLLSKNLTSNIDIAFCEAVKNNFHIVIKHHVNLLKNRNILYKSLSYAIKNGYYEIVSIIINNKIAFIKIEQYLIESIKYEQYKIAILLTKRLDVGKTNNNDILLAIISVMYKNLFNNNLL